MISFIFREMKEDEPVFNENVSVIFGGNVSLVSEHIIFHIRLILHSLQWSDKC